MGKRDIIISALRTLVAASGEDIAIDGVGPEVQATRLFLRDLETTYGFPVDPSDEAAYIGGRMSGAELIARMDKRKA